MGLVVPVRSVSAATRRRPASASASTGAPRGRSARRTGPPPFLDDLRRLTPSEGSWISRLRTAVGEAGLWDELATDWLLLDTELMPWSLKAAGLLRSQYAAVGAASGAVFPGALAALEGAAARGVEVGDLLDRQRGRAAELPPPFPIEK
ncbi:hypothetical protein [Streptomyces sp. DHE17-7]|uniref:hypothetical protein n=1 Tax=Streptomyces sp. DHE17-7 TaxID=2759949 RepID=UPI0022EAE2FE|nr:hypothetical protein [Streptomyces sp. DHE17-7]